MTVAEIGKHRFLGEKHSSLLGLLKGVTSIAVSSHYIATARTNGTVELLDSNTGELSKKFRCGWVPILQASFGVSLDSQSSRIAIGKLGRVRVLLTHDGTHVTSFPTTKRRYSYAAFSSTDRWLGLSDTGGRIEVIRWPEISRPPASELTYMLPDSANTPVTFSPDDTMLSVGCRDRRVWHCEIETAKWQSTLVGGIPTSVEYSPDGEYLAVCGSMQMLKVFVVGDTSPMYEWTNNASDNYEFRSLAFHPSKAVIAASTSQGDIVFLDINKGAQMPVTGLGSHLESDCELAWASDGNRLIHADFGEFGMWEIRLDLA